jgi:hypothetical protein
LFLKAGLLHPGVGKVLLSVVSEKIIDACFESMLKDATALSARLPLVRAGFEVYRAELLGAKAQMPDAMPWAEMKKDGTFGGFNHIDFWKTVTKDEFSWWGLRTVEKFGWHASGCSCGESIDEFCFSSSQRTLSKDRNALSGPKVEQITVIRMFIRNLGLPVGIREVAQTDVSRTCRAERCSESGRTLWMMYHQQLLVPCCFIWRINLLQVFLRFFPNITTYRNRPSPDRTEPARSAAALSALGKLLENISITIRRKFTNPFAIETSEW